MDLFFWIIVIGVIVSVVGGILWWILVIFVVASAMRSAQRDLDRLLPTLEQQMAQFGGARSGQISPQQQAQIAQMLMQAQGHMSQLDDLHRQRYETRMGDLMGVAASAGIDLPGDSFTPPPKD